MWSWDICADTVSDNEFGSWILFPRIAVMQYPMDIKRTLS